MTIEIRKLRKKDYRRVIRFADAGMHADWFWKRQWAQEAYGRYFFYNEMNHATQILAAYEGDRVVGVLLAQMRGEKKKHQNGWEMLYVKCYESVQNFFLKKGSGEYGRTAQWQRKHTLRTQKPDGEILFFAADSNAGMHGIGSALLKELEKREKGKTIFVLTDSACTWQFYEHRGFECLDEKDIIMNMRTGKIPLRCFVYSKKMG